MGVSPNAVGGTNHPPPIRTPTGADHSTGSPAHGARIDSLKSELDAAGAETKAAIQTEIDELEVKRQDAGRKLDELRAASADRWEEVKTQMASMLQDLDQRFDRMRAKLRDGKS